MVNEAYYRNVMQLQQFLPPLLRQSSGERLTGAQSSSGNQQSCPVDVSRLEKLAKQT